MLITVLVTSFFGNKIEASQAVAGEDYIIQQGDTLLSIAQEAYQDRIDRRSGADIIFRANVGIMFEVSGLDTLNPRSFIIEGVKIKIPLLVEPELIPYIEKFKEHLIKYDLEDYIAEVDSLTVSYGIAGDGENSVVGTCHRGWEQIIIDPNGSCPEFVLYHELGHCALDLPHADGLDKMMSRRLPADGCDRIDFYLNNMLENFDDWGILLVLLQQLFLALLFVLILGFVVATTSSK